jgi:uncharacterized membrane protein YcaP (DUF421 family)
VTWSIAFDLLGGRIPALRGVLHSDPVEVVHDGEILTRNLRREFMTEEELDAQLRLEGVHAIEDVARAYVEHDGRISVIRKSDARPRTRRTTTPKKHRHGTASG